MRIVTRRLPYAQLFTAIVVGVFLLILDGYKLLLCIDTLETPKVRLILGYSTGYEAALHLAFMFYILLYHYVLVNGSLLLVRLLRWYLLGAEK